jgi:two-component system response regulator PilR (NtrC family)
MHARILVVDDEPDLRTLYELTLLRAGHGVSAAASLAEARALLARQRFDVLITDMRLPDGLGLALLQELAQAQRPEKSIVITAYGSAENAVEALKAGAFDYLTKPVDPRQLRIAVTAAMQSRRGRSSVRTAAAAPSVPDGTRALACIAGSSPAIAETRARIEKVAPTMAPVLILGESGTGKELVARAVHACSHRAHGPFVAVNCGAIPDNLIEAEFFGVRKGAYTGASHDREGYFQAASGGTLFLDEIGELPLPMQAKLLRAIQERRVRPLGGVQEEAVDVRIVSATHRDLAAMVRAGQFRQDLYYRLDVIELCLPPLRERREDLPELVDTLLRRLGEESGRPPPTLSERAMTWLRNHPLPGNVRELENLLQRAMALASGPLLEPEDFGGHADGDRGACAVPPPAAPPAAAHEDAPPLPSDLQRYLDEQERAMLIRALRETGYNRTAAAQRLGLNLRQMRYRIHRLGIVMPGDEAG